jgi:hypothetical protein
LVEFYLELSVVLYGQDNSIDIIWFSKIVIAEICQTQVPNMTIQISLYKTDGHRRAQHSFQLFLINSDYRTYIGIFKKNILKYALGLNIFKKE